MSKDSQASPEADHEDSAHGHSPWLAHHFETPQQQFASAKLGMWIFLVTEILFFSGLFCAYAILRRNHPEVFMDGHLLLETSWGAINTVVLIFSSLTMALAVRAAQCDQQRALMGFLAVTILCAFGFLGIKYIEYKGKWDHNLVPGQARIQYFFSWKFVEDLFSDEGLQPPERGAEPDLHYLEKVFSGGAHGDGHGDAESHSESGQHGAEGIAAEAGPEGSGQDGEADATGPPAATDASPSTAAGGSEAPTPEAGTGEAAAESTAPAEDSGDGMPEYELQRRADNVRSFVGIYFAMTGLHGLHVIVGIGVLVWILVRSMKGHFGSEYFEPVECTGLYWHLVDLIWIYLFPLMYLIH